MKQLARKRVSRSLATAMATSRSSKSATCSFTPPKLTKPSLYRPLISPKHQDITPRILIYLPRGPLCSNEAHEATSLSRLSHLMPSHYIACINYRLSSQHMYPTPIHDTLAGFDWILENLLPKRAISRPGRARHVGRIGVFSEFVGGGLATMLALTECRVGEPRIVAAAVRDPAVDWVSLDDAAASLPDDAIEDKSSPISRLLKLRGELFPKPEKYFDPFASPLLFFRTPGVPVPPPPPVEVELDDMQQLSLLEREEYARSVAPTSVEDDTSMKVVDTMNTSGSPTMMKKRKSSLRFPRAGLNLRLPSFRISSTAGAPLARQSKELAHLLRQSHVRQMRQQVSGAGSRQGFGRKVLMEGEVDAYEEEEERVERERMAREAEERVELIKLGRESGAQKHDGEEMEATAGWLRKTME